MSLTMDKLIALCKGRGFIFAGSEIYGGLANTWDYGPLGVELKNNIKAAWWKKFVTENTNNIGMDSGILMNSAVWEASGHIGGFSDPLMDCKSCKTRHRADTLIEAHMHKQNKSTDINALSDKELEQYIVDNEVHCPVCGKSDFTGIRKFNLMFKTFQGVNEDTANTVYLRPETAQGIFIHFKNLVRTNRNRMPFGVGQIGKSFRNEITPGNFTFRTREFEQMELEFFCKPGTDLEWFGYWKNFCYDWLLGLGIKKDNVRMRDHSQDELSHYSKATTDFEFRFPFGWGELWGIADRTDFDLMCHAKKANVDMSYIDTVTNEKFVPYVIEPSLGADRVTLAFLCNAYEEEVLPKGDTRVVLKLHPVLAPIKAAILPLQKDEQIVEKAKALHERLSKQFSVVYDETGSIGKRYRRQDEIGTPYCLTVDFDSLQDDTVTIRHRDTMKQRRVSIRGLSYTIARQLKY